MDTTPAQAGAAARGARTASRLLAVAVVPATVLALAGPAAAHVTVTPSTTTAGADAVLAIGVPHGCDGSATTAVTIRIPDQIHAVAATRHPLWVVEKETVELDPPVTDSHGNTVTERVASVTYRTDQPLPDGDRDVFELGVQIPEAEGSTLAFPVIQTCEQGEAAWIEIPEGAQSPEELDQPAPAFVVTAAGAAQQPVSATDTLTAANAAGAPASARESGGDSPLLAAGALAIALLGVMLGGAAVVQQRRRA
ncbi:YcnI family protein [Nocardioides sp. SYSU D00038]|uniref:YcnI family copper-binding membrane protein n=1 Tax=Nocardioides sp. SYSU D00038 TaxID=2812554 RepID=UPI00196703AD|nr:YcnI family protein [Nocardioides sp. SYSU D00038]